jgi:hypothetical protein
MVRSGSKGKAGPAKSPKGRHRRVMARHAPVGQYRKGTVRPGVLRQAMIRQQKTDSRRYIRW